MTRDSDLYLSDKLQAPSFDAVGIPKEERPYQIRVQEGGDWSEWIRVEEGSPLTSPGADAVQVKTHFPADRIHFVRVQSDPASAFEYQEGQVGLNYISRKQWDPNGNCRPKEAPDYGTTRAVVIHHTVNANTYSQSEARALVLAICRYHRYGNEWDDIGYNALVDRFGNLYEGRAGGLSNSVEGAHVQGFNYATSGVSLIGSHESNRPSRAARRALVKWIAWKLETHALPATGKTPIKSQGGDRYARGEVVNVSRITTHGTLGVTSCPGRKAARYVPEIRERVQRRMQR